MKSGPGEAIEGVRTAPARNRGRVLETLKGGTVTVVTVEGVRVPLGGQRKGAGSRSQNLNPGGLTPRGPSHLTSTVTLAASTVTPVVTIVTHLPHGLETSMVVLSFDPVSWGTPHGHYIVTVPF